MCDCPHPRAEGVVAYAKTTHIHQSAAMVPCERRGLAKYENVIFFSQSIISITMKASDILNRIKAELAAAITPEVVEVKFAQMMLENGTILEAAEFAPENEVFIVNEEERIALPVGEYALEDGMVLVVAEEGIIAEIKELAGEETIEEEAPAPAEAAPAAEEMPMAAAEETATPKKVIESHTIEQHFAAENFVSKVEFATAIEELKGLISGMKATEEALKAELSAAPAAKPIKHNPETKHQEVKFASKKANSALERVLAKINQ